MKKIEGQQRLDRWIRFLWALTLVALPVTSFRFMPFMGSDSQVRPLSFIPAVFLFLLLIVKCLRERKFLFWSSSLAPLAGFALLALLSSGVGFLLAPPALYHYTYTSRLLRAWITLGIGLLFFFIPMAVNRDEEGLKFTLKWLFWGIVAHLVWSGLQLVQFHIVERYFEDYLSVTNLLDAVQKTFLVAGLAPNKRISGLALEPSWLAAQIAAVYLPWVVAAWLTGYRWTSRRWVLPGLLGACVFLLLFTYSRSGLLIALGAVLLTVLLAGRERGRQGWKWFVQPFVSKTMPRRRWALIWRGFAVFVVVAGVIAGSLLLSRNSYFAQIWQSDKNNLVDYVVDIYAGPRLAYAWAGWRVYEQHPWTGVGLGAVGLYLHKMLPDWSHFNIPEIAQLLSSDNLTYPNAKNLYVRLLAETGVFGFWSFLSFYFFILAKTLRLLRSPLQEGRFIGAAGLMLWIAIVALGFSQDSLAMPTVWIPLGMVAGLAEPRVNMPLPGKKDSMA